MLIRPAPPKTKTIADRILKNTELSQAAGEGKKRRVWCCFWAYEKDKNYFSLARSVAPKIQSKSTRVNGYEVHTAYTMGRRKIMEDDHAAFSIQFYGGSVKYTASVFGVFDGHGDKGEASKFVKDHLAEILKKKLEEENLLDLSDEGIWKALRKTFCTLDENYEGMGGTTATVAMILLERLWVANCGDSRTVVASSGLPIQMSQDATPYDRRFMKKVYKLGGGLTYDHYVSMRGLFCSLAMTRSIGDKSFSCVVPDPKITCRPLSEFKKGSYLALASDGLWDEISSRQLAESIEYMAKNHKSPLKMAERLVSSTFFSHDNTTLSIIPILENNIMH